MDDMIELRECRAGLKSVLQRLDSIGAGIAAIHVDAAIAQLKNNIDLAEEALSQDYDPTLISIYENARVPQ